MNVLLNDTFFRRKLLSAVVIVFHVGGFGYPETSTSAVEGDERLSEADQTPGQERQRGTQLLRTTQKRQQQWWLGVEGNYLRTGMEITKVHPGTPADGIGLKRDDIIVTVNGFQIGYIYRQLYPLDAELQNQADDQGRVLLLVWKNSSQHLKSGRVQLVPRHPPDNGDGEVSGTVVFSRSDVPTAIKEMSVLATIFDGRKPLGKTISEKRIVVEEHHIRDGMVRVKYEIELDISEIEKKDPHILSKLQAYLVVTNEMGREYKLLSSGPMAHRLKREKKQKVDLQLRRVRL